MRSAPPGCVKIGRVQSRHVHNPVQRADDALLYELAHPRQVHGDQIVTAFGAFGVAQRFFAQPVDAESTLMNGGANDLFKLAF